MKKRLKTTKAERREANEQDCRARLRAKWRQKKTRQRAAKPRPEPDAAQSIPEPQDEFVAPSLPYGVSPVDGMGLVFEDSGGTRYERESFDSKWKRVGDLGSAAIPALTPAEAEARREEISNGPGRNARPTSAIDMQALFGVRHLSR